MAENVMDSPRGSTTKVPSTSLPAGLVAVIGPVVAARGTTARTWVSESMLSPVATVPLKATDVSSPN
jgi:hypothetical protein